MRSHSIFTFRRVQYFLLVLTAIFLLPFAVRAATSSPLYTYQQLSTELAQQAAMQSLLACRQRGYSVAVAVVDRGGNLQAFVRDRYAGPHTTETAIRKAWTSNSFHQPTGVLAEFLQQGRIPAQVQHNPGVLLVGGGITIEAQGQLLGAIGVSGAPPGKSESESIDGACAQAGLETLREVIEFAE